MEQKRRKPETRPVRGNTKRNRKAVGWRFFTVGVLIGCGIWLVLGLVPYLLAKTDGSISAFGDAFGAANALISAFAFAGVLAAIKMQDEQLAMQRQELGLQRKELEDSRAVMRQQEEQMRDQAETMRRQRFESLLFSLCKRLDEMLEQTAYFEYRGTVSFNRFMNGFANHTNNLTGQPRARLAEQLLWFREQKALLAFRGAETLCEYLLWLIQKRVMDPELRRGYFQMVIYQLPQEFLVYMYSLKEAQRATTGKALAAWDEVIAAGLLAHVSDNLFVAPFDRQDYAERVSALRANQATQAPNS